MAQLIDHYIKLETLETLVSVLKKKEAKGISLTFSVNDTQNDYGQNVNAFVSQSKEEREAKKPKFYVGNGKTFWSDKGEFKPVKDQAPTVAADHFAQADEDDLPF